MTLYKAESERFHRFLSWFPVSVVVCDLFEVVRGVFMILVVVLAALFSGPVWKGLPERAGGVRGRFNLSVEKDGGRHVVAFAQDGS